jgi:hypothetical protein
MQPPAALSLNHNRRILTWTSSDCKNFWRPLQCHRVHATATPTTSNIIGTTPPPPRPPPTPSQSPPPGPRRPNIIVVPRNHAVLPAVTTVGSTPPDRHHRAWEPPCPPCRQHHRVHTARPSPPPGPRHPDLFYLQQFGEPFPSISSILLCLDVCLYDYI